MASIKKQRGIGYATAQRLTAVGVAAAVLSAATSASANKYAGLIATGIAWPTAARGAAIKLWTDILDAASCTTEFVNHEMWYGTNGSGSTWVEVGFTHGYKAGGQSGCANHVAFWAENDSSGVYKEHYPAFSWSYNTEYLVLVDYTGSTGSDWDVWIGSTKLGTAHNNYAGTTRYLQSGLEATTSAAGNHVRGWAYDWQAEDNTGALQTGWGGGEDLICGGSCVANSPAQSQFDPNFAWMTEEVLHESF